MSQPQPSHRPNTITHEEIMTLAAQLGAEAARGKDTQIKSLLKCLDGAYHGVLDLKKNKHGTDMDDATKYAEAYFKARNANAIFDHKADNQQKLASTIRTSIKLGSTPKFGNGEPIATVNSLMTIYQKEKAGPNRKRLNDAANVFLKYAREQLKKDTLLTDAELKELCFKPTPDEPTAEEIIAAIVKKLDKVVDGSAGGGTIQVKTTNVLNARQALRNELAAIAKAKPKSL